MESNNIERFNVRVYLLFIENDRLLVSDEIIGGKFCTKFPGGGLEFGESTLECAHREAMEELNSEIEVTEHFFTTDEFVLSSFRDEDQILSIYYRCRFVAAQNFRVAKKKFDFQEAKEREESFRWVPIGQLSNEQMTFKMDQKVKEMLLATLDF
ncbi:MAG: NUDIX domain-containing protein [Flavobacteriales bacterium]